MATFGRVSTHQMTTLRRQLLGRGPAGQPPGGFERPPGGMAPGHRPREKLAELTDDVILGVAQASHQLFRLLSGPGFPAGGQAQPRLARPVTQNIVREDSLDVPRVEPVGQFLGQCLIHPAQKFGFPEAERGISPRPGEVSPAGVDAQNSRETHPEQVSRAAARHSDHMDVIRRDVL